LFIYTYSFFSFTIEPLPLLCKNSALPLSKPP
jgi:hypothetical protein